MIVAEPYQRDGRTILRNLHRAEAVPPGYVDTGLSSMPTGFERLAWDGTQVVPIVPTAEEKLGRLSLPPRVLAALVVGALPAGDTTSAEKAWARDLLLEVRDRIRAATAS